MSKNLSELSGRKGLEDNLFDRMGKLAERDGAPDTAELDKLAEEFLVGSANTYGTTKAKRPTSVMEQPVFVQVLKKK